MCKLKIPLSIMLILLTISIFINSCRTEDRNSVNKNPDEIAVELYKENKSGEAIKSANSENKKSADIYKNNKFYKALKLHNKAIEKDPNNPVNWFNKGKNLTFLCEYKEAIKCYDRVLKIDRNNKKALFNKGWCLKYLNNYKESLKYFERILEIDPKNKAVLYYKKDILAALNPAKCPSPCSYGNLFYHFRTLDSMAQMYAWEEEYGTDKAVEMTVSWLNSKMKGHPVPAGITGADVESMIGERTVYVYFSDGNSMAFAVNGNKVPPRNDSPLHKAVARGDKDLVKSLIKSGADVNCENSRGDTPLHNDKELIDLCVSKGASIYIKDKDNNGLLHKAVECGHIETVRWLISIGMDVNDKNNYEETPLHFAVRDEQTEIAEYLIRAGH